MVKRSPVKVDARRIIKVSELRAHTSEWIKASEEEPVLVLRHGKPAAYLIGPDLLEKFLKSSLIVLSSRRNLSTENASAKAPCPLKT